MIGTAWKIVSRRRGRIMEVAKRQCERIMPIKFYNEITRKIIRGKKLMHFSEYDTLVITPS